MRHKALPLGLRILRFCRPSFYSTYASTLEVGTIWNKVSLQMSRSSRLKITKSILGKYTKLEEFCNSEYEPPLLGATRQLEDVRNSFQRSSGAVIGDPQCTLTLYGLGTPPGDSSKSGQRIQHSIVFEQFSLMSESSQTSQSPELYQPGSDSESDMDSTHVANTRASG